MFNRQLSQTSTNFYLEMSEPILCTYLFLVLGCRTRLDLVLGLLYSMAQVLALEYYLTTLVLVARVSE